MSQMVLDRSALDELQDTAGAEFASALFSQIRADFARLHDAALGQMRAFAPTATPDYDTTRRVVHEMKGLSLTVGAAGLAQACSEAELLAQQNDMSALARALPDIIGLCNRVRIELEQCITGAE